MTTTEEITRLTEEIATLSKPWPKAGTPESEKLMGLKKQLRKAEMSTLCGDGIMHYDSNNSGGGWWISDEGWKALEEAGWTVHWCMKTRNEFGESWTSGRTYGDSPLALLERAEIGQRDGWRRPEEILVVPQSYEEAVGWDARWLGGLAMSAAKAGPDPEALVAEWESATGCNAGDEGCNCCGPPHSFEWHSPDGESHYGGIEVTSRFTGFS